MRAIVVGARPDSGNIGDAIATELENDGWSVATTDGMVSDGSRPPGGNLPNDDVAREHGYVVTDKGRYGRYDAPSVQALSQGGGFDACVITLGATYKDHFTEVAEHDLRRVLDACLYLPLITARRYVQACEGWKAKKRETGLYQERPFSIVFIGSYAHNHPFTNGTAYCAAKAGLNMAAKTLGWELTEKGYAVHVVHPFHVQGTPMWDQVEREVAESKGISEEEAKAYTRKDLKMPDLSTAEDVADIVRILLSQEPAARWLSGTAIEMYGGTR